MTAEQVFHELTGALDKTHIHYMVVGSFASNLYGAGRATLDIDIVVSATPDQIQAFLRLLPTTTYYF